MTWSQLYTQDVKPTLEQIDAYIASPYWTDLISFIASTYGLDPQMEYSKCKAAPGWNVKFKKSGRSLCTLYPESGAFTCLISIGSKEAAQTELLLPDISPYIRELYQNTKPFNGSRWLMVQVTSIEMLQDVKKLLHIRMHP